jgi:predicted dehydrogenase
MEPLRVGVIGLGRMGGNHCRVYSSLSSARLVAVCDRDLELGYQIGEQYEVRFCPEVDELLECVDAVSVVTPTPAHFDLAMRCVEKGVHVLVEKPITETVAEAEKLTQAAQASGLIVQVGHIERFNPTYTELKNVVADMSVLAINLRRLSAYKGSNTDVDVVLDLMIHDLDLALDLVGQAPTSVIAQGLTAFDGAIDHAVAHLCFGEGPLLTLTASRVTEQKVRSIEVTAREAYVIGDLLNKNISLHRRTIGEYLNYNHRGVKYRQESVVEYIHVPMFEPLFLELQHFVDCVLGGRPSLVPARDGLRVLRLAEVIREAIREHVVTARKDLETAERARVGAC